MSKSIFIKWAPNERTIRKTASEQILRIFKNKEEVKEEGGEVEIEPEPERWWLLGDYDEGSRVESEVRELKIDAGTDCLYFIKYQDFQMWNSYAIYVFLSDEDRLEFIQNELSNHKSVQYSKIQIFDIKL